MFPHWTNIFLQIVEWKKTWGFYTHKLKKKNVHRMNYLFKPQKHELFNRSIVDYELVYIFFK